MDALFYLTGIAIILFLGLLVSILSDRLKISNMLLLIIIGIIAGYVEYDGVKIFEFPSVFLVCIATLALVMIVFDGSSKMKFKEIDELSSKALKVTGLAMLFNMLLGGLVCYLLFFNEFKIANIILSLVFGVLMAGTDPGSVFIMFKDSTHKLLKFLKVEAIVNTPLVVLIPFILLEFISGTEVSIISKLGPFLQQIFTGIGTGLVMGIIIFKLMKKAYSQQYSPIALLATTLITYIASENLGGNGVLAVATLGLIFGSVYIKNKSDLSGFSSLLSTSLEILVFVLVGIIIDIPWEPWFIIKSFILFIILILCRYLALKITFKEEYPKKSLIFMALNMSKGIAIASVTFTLALFTFEGIPTLVNLTLICMIYSLIVATIASLVAKNFVPDINSSSSEKDDNKDVPDLSDEVKDN